MPSRARDNAGDARETKTCTVCGRAMQWRSKWARDWDNVKYCSAACRRTGLSDADRALEAAIVNLLHGRAAGASICPSEAARVVAPETWRELMEPARCAARRLVAQGRCVITQQGYAVDPSTAKGPIRVRLSTQASPA